MILVSACLAGFRCTYDDKDKELKEIVELIKKGKAIPVCPEQLGGLTTPRCAAECKRVGNDIKVITKDGMDVTKGYEIGAKKTLDIAKKYNCEIAIMKRQSPTCGVKTYDGSFSGTLADYPGITAGLLMRNGIEVISSDDEEKIKEIVEK